MMNRAFVREIEAARRFEESAGSPYLFCIPISSRRRVSCTSDEEIAQWRSRLAEAQARDDRAEISRASRDLRYWTYRRATAEVVPDPVDHSHVRFGSTVTFKREDGREQSYRIVGEDEADPGAGTISYVSPLAQA